TRNCCADAGNRARRSVSSAMDRLRAASSVCSRASRIAGARTFAQGSRPALFQASYIPATLPGTPDARCPVRLCSVGLPVESTYMARVAPPGGDDRVGARAGGSGRRGGGRRSNGATRRQRGRRPRARAAAGGEQGEGGKQAVAHAQL